MRRKMLLGSWVTLIGLALLMSLPKIASGKVFEAYGSKEIRKPRVSEPSVQSLPKPSVSRPTKPRAKTIHKARSSRQLKSVKHRHQPATRTFRPDTQPIQRWTYIPYDGVHVNVGDLLRIRRDGRYICTVKVVRLYGGNTMDIRYVSGYGRMAKGDKISKIPISKPDSARQNSANWRWMLSDYSGQSDYVPVEINLWKHDGSMFLNPNFRVEIDEGNGWLVWDPVKSSSLKTYLRPGRWVFNYNRQGYNWYPPDHGQFKDLAIGVNGEVNIFVDNDCDPATIIIRKAL